MPLYKVKIANVDQVRLVKAATIAGAWPVFSPVGRPGAHWRR